MLVSQQIMAVEVRNATPEILRGHPLFIARALWIALTITSANVFIVALPVRFNQILHSSPEIVSARLALGLSNEFIAVYLVAMEIAVAVVFALAGVLIFWLKSTDRMAVFVSFVLFTGGLASPPILETMVPHPFWYWPVFLVQSMSFGGNIILFYLFPSGQFVPRWTRYLAAVMLMWIVAGLVLPPNFPNHPRNWPVLLWALVVIGWFATSAFAQLYRYRYVSTFIQRQQTKWIVFGSIGSLIPNSILVLLYLILPSLNQPGPSQELYILLTHPFYYLIFPALMPISIAISILRYHLWDIDVVINRSLVYGTLTAVIVGVYALAVSALDTVFRTNGNFFISLFAAGLVAALFQPARERLQRGVNRLMYGDRDDPYAVLSRLSQRLKTALKPQAALPIIVETIAQALKLPYVAIALRDGEAEAFSEVAVHHRSSTPTAELAIIPLIYQGEIIGQLRVAPRSPGEPFTPPEQRLLDDLAQQAGAAAQALRLTADLQQARERLITTREEERRVLHRNLHDRIGPALAGLRLKIEAAQNLLGSDPMTGDSLLADAAAQTQSVAGEIQNTIYHLRPPALDQLGLVGAIRNHPLASNNGSATQPQVDVEAPEPLPPLPAAVEVAAYHIAMEALNNVVRHAQASVCRLALSMTAINQKYCLHLEICDDGLGLPPHPHSGVGIASMRERAEELGGTFRAEPGPNGSGTCVIAELPFPKLQ